MRTDRQDPEAGLPSRENRAGDYLRDWALSAERNYDGDRVQRTTLLNGTVRHLNFWGAGLHLRHGARAYDGADQAVLVNVNLPTSPWWNTSIGPYLSRIRVAAQYVGTMPDPEATETYAARYLFAPLDYTHLREDLRLNLTVTPPLPWTYPRPLIFAPDLGEVGALAAPRTCTHRRGRRARRLPPFLDQRRTGPR